MKMELNDSLSQAVGDRDDDECAAKGKEGAPPVPCGIGVGLICACQQEPDFCFLLASVQTCFPLKFSLSPARIGKVLALYYL